MARLLIVTWLSKAGRGAALVGAVLLWGEFAHWRSARRRMGTRAGAQATGEAVVARVPEPRHPRQLPEPVAGPGRPAVPAAGAGSVAAGDLREPGRRPGARGRADGLLRARARVHRCADHRAHQPVDGGEHPPCHPVHRGRGPDQDRSNSLHAERARGCLWKLRPDLAVRLVPSADYRFGELILLKPLLAAIGLATRSDASRPPRCRPRSSPETVAAGDSRAYGRQGIKLQLINGDLRPRMIRGLM